MRRRFVKNDYKIQIYEEEKSPINFLIFLRLYSGLRRHLPPHLLLNNERNYSRRLPKTLFLKMPSAISFVLYISCYILKIKVRTRDVWFKSHSKFRIYFVQKKIILSKKKPTSISIDSIIILQTSSLGQLPDEV